MEDIAKSVLKAITVIQWHRSENANHVRVHLQLEISQKNARRRSPNQISLYVYVNQVTR